MISFMLCYNHLLHNKMLCGNIQFYSVSLSNHKLLPYKMKHNRLLQLTVLMFTFIFIPK